MPDAVKRTVVVNTTPIIALALLDRLDILEALYGEVWIPQAVRDEIIAGADRPGAAELARSPCIRVAVLADPTPVRLLSDLDRGEAEVIALALQMVPASSSSTSASRAATPNVSDYGSPVYSGSSWQRGAPGTSPPCARSSTPWSPAGSDCIRT